MQIKAFSYRPSLASNERIGFFSKDAASQTEQSDIMDIKDVTVAFQSLLKVETKFSAEKNVISHSQNFSNTKRDLDFAKHALQADYEARMDARASELYKWPLTVTALPNYNTTLFTLDTAVSMIDLPTSRSSTQRFILNVRVSDDNSVLWVCREFKW